MSPPEPWVESTIGLTGVSPSGSMRALRNRDGSWDPQSGSGLKRTEQRPVGAWFALTSKLATGGEPERNGQLQNSVQNPHFWFLLKSFFRNISKR